MDRRSFLGAGLGLVAEPALAQAPAVSGRTCYTMSFAGLDKGEIKLADFAGKPIMVVNTASLCGFVGQYAGLQMLWERFSPMGLMMIAVPSNDFGGQEPGGSDEIHHATEGYGVRFPIAAKAKVLGPDAHPFYRWAALERPRDLPRWNFHKYLVGKDGRIADVFSTITDPASATVVRAVEKEFRSSSSAG